eukprot:TRINITY_DN21662_c0_g1_i1.p1 TRINITY_DN21662_c0_g1~~TRINITY_DN21662_c0_g1_i1.p1  ORF type:complete len:142 (+),score=5.44 TRINITY_DN21662_c0_g1_i1:193-618(+)
MPQRLPSQSERVAPNFSFRFAPGRPRHRINECRWHRVNLKQLLGTGHVHFAVPPCVQHAAEPACQKQFLLCKTTSADPFTLGHGQGTAGDCFYSIITSQYTKPAEQERGSVKCLDPSIIMQAAARRQAKLGTKLQSGRMTI